VTAKDEYERRKKDDECRRQNDKALRVFGGGSFRHPDRMVRFTFGVFVFTGLLSIVALIQAWAFIQSERAFLAMEAITIQGGMQVGKPLITKLTFKNSGRSPATDVVIHYNSSVLPLPSIPEFGPNFTDVPPIVSGGNTIVSFGPPQLMEEAHIQEFKSGKSSFYVWGYVSFRDDFSIWSSREVGFCAVFDQRSAGDSFESCHQKAYTDSR
jgi:hypothetical protein